MEVLDVLDQRTRPSLDRFREACRKMKKVPYSEMVRIEVIDVSDEDEGDIEMMVDMGVMAQGKWTKDELLLAGELNNKQEESMKAKLAAAQEKQARKMEALQEEIKAVNAKQD